MAEPNANYSFAVPFIDALAELGLRHVCITPGSRSTPLTLACAGNEAITDWSHHDERSSAFFALGMAAAGGVPVAIVTTSGTAAAELLPAIVEARLSRIPLLVLTADRPAELRNGGAPQTIDQVKLFGDAVKWYHEAASPPGADTAARHGRSAAQRAWAAALDDPPGPVHLNFPFREPLVGAEADLVPPARLHPALVHRQGRLQPDEATLNEVAGLIDGRRTLIVCGPQRDGALAPAVAALGAAAGLPILADPLSQVRSGAHDKAAVIASGHSLAAAGFLERHPPEAILRFGALPTSKPVFTRLTGHTGVPQVVVDSAGWRDPDGGASYAMRSDAVAAASGLVKALATGAPAEWLATWRHADDLASEAIAQSIAAAGFPTEPGVVAAIGRSVPAGATLWVASSMPVRDVDAYLPSNGRSLRVMANRGANGIDGFLSSGLGSALADPSPTYLLCGDLSALYDLTALSAAGRLQIPATIIVVNNDGGGIFHFLPQAGQPAHFERHFGTPHGIDFVAAAAVFGVEATSEGSAEELAAIIAQPPRGPRLVEVKTNRAENVAVHHAVQAAVDQAVKLL